jgi:hypothetical protein
MKKYLKGSGLIRKKKPMVMAPAASKIRTDAGSFHVDIGLEVRPSENSAG